MAFDIRQRMFNRDGEPIEKAAGRYQEQLVELFWKSPEGQALVGEGMEPGFWANSLLDYGIGYLGVTPPQMTPGNLREILFDLIPRKVSASADEAPEAIRELRAFWKFLQREFNLENAAACLNMLDDKAERQLKREMSDPANFGMAKSIVMMGKERGFDMSTEEGINKWMLTYNLELAAGMGKPVPLPGERIVDAEPAAAPGSGFSLFGGGGRGGGAGKAQDKTKRKMARVSRKKNHKRR